MEELLKLAKEELYSRWIGGSGFGFRFQGRMDGRGITGRCGEGTSWRWVICGVIFLNICFDFLGVILLQDLVF